VVRDGGITELFGAFAAQMRYVTIEDSLGCFAALLIERYERCPTDAALIKRDVQPVERLVQRTTRHLPALEFLESPFHGVGSYHIQPRAQNPLITYHSITYHIPRLRR